MKLLAPVVLLFVAVALRQTRVTNALPCECDPAQWGDYEDPCNGSPPNDDTSFTIMDPEPPAMEFSDPESTGAVMPGGLPELDLSMVPADVMLEEEEFVDLDSDGVLDVPELVDLDSDGVLDVPEPTSGRFGYNEIISKFESRPAKRRDQNSQVTHTEAIAILNRAMETADQWYQTVNAFQTPMALDHYHNSERKVGEVRRKQAKRNGLDYVDEKPDYHNFYEMEDDVNRLEEGNSLLPKEPVVFTEENFGKIREHASPLLIELENLNHNRELQKQLTRMTQRAERAAEMRREFEARRQRAQQEKADNITRRSVEDEEEISRGDMLLMHEILTTGETAARKQAAKQAREVLHQYESADVLEFACGPFHYLYQGSYMAPWFSWTWSSAELDQWGNGEYGCADFFTQLDMEAYTLLAQLLEAFKLVKWILELVCEAIPDSCGASKGFEAAIYIFEVFQRGANYHLDFSHTTIQDGFLASINEIHVAITCNRIPENQMEGVKYLGCNGMDDNCDETIDDRAEDHYGPEIHTHHASPMDLGWFNDRDMGEEAVEESTYCIDDCLASPVLTFNSPSKGQCTNNYYKATCTDVTNNVAKDIAFYLDEESPSVDLCLGKSDFTTGEVKSNNYEDIQLSYQVEDNCGADTLREKVLIVEMNEDITPSLEEDTLVRFRSAPHHTEFVKVLPPRRGLPIIVRVLTERLAVKQDTRVYRFTIRATDSAGNSNSDSENVYVGSSDDTMGAPMYELFRLPLPSTTSADVAGSSCGTPRKYEDIQEVAFQQSQILVGQDKEPQTQFLETGVL